MKPITKHVIAAFAAMLIPATVMAQSHDARNQGYLVDTNGTIVTSSNTGLCARDSDWTPARSVEPCDPTNRPLAAIEPAPRPAVVAVAPPAPPAPTPQSEPAKPVPQTISFSGDALFDFDKSVLTPEGKAMLDDLVRQLDGATYDTILAVGHTDRIGSDRYNQKLSEDRAQAVRNYLVSKNVQAGRIEAEGVGKSQPVTKAGDCRGPKSAKVIACLQPDRRVEVEVQGTKVLTGSR